MLYNLGYTSYRVKGTDRSFFSITKSKCSAKSFRDIFYGMIVSGSLANSLLSFKRAGCDGIFTDFATRVVENFENGSIV